MLNNYYYDILSSQEQYAYTVIKNALLNNEQKCTVTNRHYSNKDITETWSAVVLDHPEFIHYPGLFCVPSVSENTITIRLEYSDVDYALFQTRLDRMTDEIEHQLPSNASDYLVCKKIYDKLASIVKYDSQVLDDYLRLASSNPSGHDLAAFMTERSAAFTPYGILVNSQGVCQGIAKLYKILCDKFGVQCACVEAKTNDSYEYPHMLNVVEISGKRAFVDVTNGLKTGVKGLPLVRYDYFLASTRVYLKAYRVDRDFECNDETLNYYHKNKVWFNSFDDMRRYLCSYTIASTKGEIRCYYDGNALDDEQLGERFSEILTSHCQDGFRLKGYYVKNGFCVGLITNDMED